MTTQKIQSVTSGKKTNTYIIYMLCVNDCGDKYKNESRECNSIQLGHRGREETMLHLDLG